MVAGASLRARLVAVLALALSVGAGLAYMAGFGAPSPYLAVNAGALALAALVVVALPVIDSLALRRLLTVALLALLFLPLLTGPYSNGVARWLPLGPVVLHSGMLLIPSLVVLAARDEDYAAPILLLALAAVHLQPDTASGMAICFAAIGRYDAVRDWRMGVVAAIAFVAALAMAARGEFPPQPFVERVIVSAAMDMPLAAPALLAALLASFFLILKAVPGERAARHALAGSLFGFAMVALVANYPTPLIGYGAAPILGYGLALALARTRARIGRPVQTLEG